MEKHAATQEEVNPPLTEEDPTHLQKNVSTHLAQRPEVSNLARSSPPQVSTEKINTPKSSKKETTKEEATASKPGTSGNPLQQPDLNTQLPLSQKKKSEAEFGRDSVEKLEASTPAESLKEPAGVTGLIEELDHMVNDSSRVALDRKRLEEQRKTAPLSEGKKKKKRLTQSNWSASPSRMKHSHKTSFMGTQHSTCYPSFLKDYTGPGSYNLPQGFFSSKVLRNSPAFSITGNLHNPYRHISRWHVHDTIGRGIPGVGEYSPTVDMTMPKIRGVMLHSGVKSDEYSMKKQVSKQDIPYTLRSPGPQYFYKPPYDIYRHATGPVFMKDTRSAQKPVRSRQESPSPGEYSLPSAFYNPGSKKGVSIGPTKVNLANAWNQSLQSLETNVKLKPGPGQYSPQFMHEQSLPAFSFSKAGRGLGPLEKKNIVGPGRYNPAKHFDTLITKKTANTVFGKSQRHIDTRRWDVRILREQYKI